MRARPTSDGRLTAFGAPLPCRHLDLDLRLGHGKRRADRRVGGTAGPRRRATTSETAGTSARSGMKTRTRTMSSTSAPASVQRPRDDVDRLLGLRGRAFREGAGGAVEPHGAGDEHLVPVDDRAAVAGEALPFRSGRYELPCHDAAPRLVQPAARMCSVRKAIRNNPGAAQCRRCQTTASSSTTSRSRWSRRPEHGSIAAPDPATISSCRGEMLHLPPGQGFSIYSLAAVLPLLAAKQRATAPNDWMSTDAEVACPDPNCPSRLRISRTGKRRFSHAEVTAVPLPTPVAPHERRADRSRSRLCHLAHDPRRLAARRRAWRRSTASAPSRTCSPSWITA